MTKKPLILALLAGLLLWLWHVCGCGWEPGYKRWPKELLQQLKERTTPEELRSWLARAEAAAVRLRLTDADGAAELPEDQWPAWIHTIKRRYPFEGVTLYTGTNSTIARFCWTAHEAIMGLEVSSSTNAASLSEGEELCFNVEWVPGIYTWHNRPPGERRVNP